MDHDVARFAQVASRVWDVPMDENDLAGTAAKGIDAFRDFLISIGMPSNFEGLGAREEDIPVLVKNLCYGNGRDGKIYGFTTLDENDCTKIYQMMV